ncbi:MAG: hypothetical protein WCT14_21515 [Treponemataceae bacterium]
MSHIFLVGSVHEEKGLTTVKALVQILMNISPDVVFLEKPITLNEQQIKNGINETLESKAVGVYSSYKAVKLVPVDLPTPGNEFFKDNKYLFTEIEKASKKYCRLIDCDGQYIANYGFAYLNSIHCDKLWNELYEEVNATVQQLSKEKLFQLQKEWQDKIEQRDIEMLSNIRKYCSENNFERAVFLIGASHRRSIKMKVEETNFAEFSNISWNFEPIPS